MLDYENGRVYVCVVELCQRIKFSLFIKKRTEELGMCKWNVEKRYNRNLKLSQKQKWNSDINVPKRTSMKQNTNRSNAYNLPSNAIFMREC